MNNLSKLKDLRYKDTFTAESSSLVTKEFLKHHQVEKFPLLIRPRFKGVSAVEWVKKNRAEFETELLKHGALLLRGFDIETLDDFGKFVDSFETKPLTYMFRSSPRHELDKNVKNVYNSTIYPKAEKINLHNESSYSRTWGMKIMFCCLQPAEEGGETPIADSRKILCDIPAELVEKFRAKGVMYRRKLIRDIGMSWQEVFQTDDKQIVEAVCQENDIRYDFVSDDHLNIEWVKKAVYRHPKTEEETWFNHIFFFNKFSRYEELGAAPNDNVSDDLIHTDTLFGDGTSITWDEYMLIKHAYNKNTIAFRYEKGDIIFLDNMLAAHGRSPYKGSRTIATAIIEPASDFEMTTINR
jgi:alpha-ketoglutarate-dependent taurine dioxygenase